MLTCVVRFALMSTDALHSATDTGPPTATDIDDTQSLDPPESPESPADDVRHWRFTRPVVAVTVAAAVLVTVAAALALQPAAVLDSSPAPVSTVPAAAPVTYPPDPTTFEPTFHPTYDGLPPSVPSVPDAANDSSQVIDPYASNGQWLVPSQVAPGTYLAVQRDPVMGRVLICADLVCAPAPGGGIGTGTLINQFVVLGRTYVTIPADAAMVQFNGVSLTRVGQ